MLFVGGTVEVFAGEFKNHFYSNNPIAAEVDGEPIYLDDLKHVRIQEVLKQLHEMQTRSLKEKILEKLAEKHPELKAEQAPKVTAAKIKKFYIYSVEMVKSILIIVFDVFWRLFFILKFW